MLETKLEADAVHIGKHFSVSFQRTLRIPDEARITRCLPDWDASPSAK